MAWTDKRTGNVNCKNKKRTREMRMCTHLLQVQGNTRLDCARLLFTRQSLAPVNSVAILRTPPCCLFLSYHIYCGSILRSRLYLLLYQAMDSSLLCLIVRMSVKIAGQRAVALTHKPPLGEIVRPICSLRDPPGWLTSLSVNTNFWYIRISMMTPSSIAILKLQTPRNCWLNSFNTTISVFLF